METSIGAAKRQRTEGTKKSKDSCIRRELRKLYTAGTLVDENLIGDAKASYLLSIKVLCIPNLRLPTGKLSFLRRLFRRHRYRRIQPRSIY